MHYTRTTGGRPAVISSIRAKQRVAICLFVDVTQGYDRTVIPLFFSGSDHHGGGGHGATPLPEIAGPALGAGCCHAITPNPLLEFSGHVSADGREFPPLSRSSKRSPSLTSI